VLTDVRDDCFDELFARVPPSCDDVFEDDSTRCSQAGDRSDWRKECFGAGVHHGAVDEKPDPEATVAPAMYVRSAGRD
jgi:hypothetical protein